MTDTDKFSPNFRRAVIADLTIAEQVINNFQQNTCTCDPEVGHICEDCFVRGAIASARRILENDVKQMEGK